MSAVGTGGQCSGCPHFVGHRAWLRLGWKQEAQSHCKGLRPTRGVRGTEAVSLLPQGPLPGHARAYRWHLRVEGSPRPGKSRAGASRRGLEGSEPKAWLGQWLLLGQPSSCPRPHSSPGPSYSGQGGLSVPSPLWTPLSSCVGVQVWGCTSLPLSLPGALWGSQGLCTSLPLSQVPDLAQDALGIAGRHTPGLGG